MKENIDRVWVSRVGMVFLGLLVCLLVFDIWRAGIYTKELGFNIFVSGVDSAGLLLVRPEEDITYWVGLPKNLKIKIYETGGYYPVVSLWNYGVLEKRPYEIIEKSVGSTLGIVVPRVIQVSGVASADSVLGNLHRLGLKTNLSIRDRWYVRKYLTEGLLSKKILELDMPANAFDKQVDPDGKEYLLANTVASLWTKNKFAFEGILAENVDVVVNNTSGRKGGAGEMARQLESCGMRVVEVKSDEEDKKGHDECTYELYGRYPLSERILSEQMRCKKEITGQGSGEKGIGIWLN